MDVTVLKVLVKKWDKKCKTSCLAMSEENSFNEGHRLGLEDCQKDLQTLIDLFGDEE